MRAENFTWISGEEKLSAYESSPGKKRYFCSNCGSQLLAIKEGAPFYVLRVASLDDATLSKPAFRKGKSHEVSWLDYQSDVPEYSEWQPER